MAKEIVKEDSKRISENESTKSNVETTDVGTEGLTPDVKQVDKPISDTNSLSGTVKFDKIDNQNGGATRSSDTMGQQSVGTPGPSSGHSVTGRRGHGKPENRPGMRIIRDATIIEATTTYRFNGEDDEVRAIALAQGTGDSKHKGKETEHGNDYTDEKIRKISLQTEVGGVNYTRLADDRSEHSAETRSDDVIGAYNYETDSYAHVNEGVEIRHDAIISASTKTRNVHDQSRQFPTVTAVGADGLVNPEDNTVISPQRDTNGAVVYQAVPEAAQLDSSKEYIPRTFTMEMDVNDAGIVDSDSLRFKFTEDEIEVATHSLYEDNDHLIDSDDTYSRTSDAIYPDTVREYFHADVEHAKIEDDESLTNIKVLGDQAPAYLNTFMHQQANEYKYLDERIEEFDATLALMAVSCEQSGFKSFMKKLGQYGQNSNRHFGEYVTNGYPTFQGGDLFSQIRQGAIYGSNGLRMLMVEPGNVRKINNRGAYITNFMGRDTSMFSLAAKQMYDNMYINPESFKAVERFLETGKAKVGGFNKPTVMPGKLSLKSKVSINRIFQTTSDGFLVKTDKSAHGQFLNSESSVYKTARYIDDLKGSVVYSHTSKVLLGLVNYLWSTRQKLAKNVFRRAGTTTSHNANSTITITLPISFDYEYGSMFANLLCRAANMINTKAFKLAHSARQAETKTLWGKDNYFLTIKPCKDFQLRDSASQYWSFHQDDRSAKEEQQKPLNVDSTLSLEHQMRIFMPLTPNIMREGSSNNDIAFPWLDDYKTYQFFDKTPGDTDARRAAYSEIASYIEDSVTDPYFGFNYLNHRHAIAGSLIKDVIDKYSSEDMAFEFAKIYDHYIVPPVLSIQRSSGARIRKDQKYNYPILTFNDSYTGITTMESLIRVPRVKGYTVNVVANYNNWNHTTGQYLGDLDSDTRTYVNYRIRKYMLHAVNAAEDNQLDFERIKSLSGQTYLSRVSYDISTAELSNSDSTKAGIELLYKFYQNTKAVLSNGLYWNHNHKSSGDQQYTERNAAMRAAAYTDFGTIGSGTINVLNLAQIVRYYLMENIFMISPFEALIGSTTDGNGSNYMVDPMSAMNVYGITGGSSDGYGNVIVRSAEAIEGIEDSVTGSRILTAYDILLLGKSDVEEITLAEEVDKAVSETVEVETTE